MAFSKISEMTLKTTGRSKSLVVFGVSGPPTNLTASNSNIGTINLSWNAPSVVPGAPTITSYTIFISGASSAQINTGNTNTSYSWTGGTKGSSYSFYVVANNAGGSSSPSNTVSSEVLGNVATGGTTTDVSNYNGTGQTWRVHTFTSGGTFTATSTNQPFRILVVGGGGGAGNASKAGGGGGGGVLVNAAATLSAQTHTVTVGGGGGRGSNGGSSGISTFTANGGSVGGGRTANGGASGAPTSFAGGAGDNVYASGGGGGAGSVGGNVRGYELSGVGGNGITSNVTGTLTYYGGGGGGGHNTGVNSPSPGGLGGGGQTESSGTNGLGGGGGGATEGIANGGSGGSGRVVVAYQLS